MKSIHQIASLALLVLFSATSAFSAPKSKWESLFKDDLSNANYNKGVWTLTDGVLTADKDEVLWTRGKYENYILELDFKTESGANSGVLVYCTDPDNWIPHSVEVQITDDYHEKWAKADKTWQCGAIFGHLAANESRVKKPGKWNHYSITCIGQRVKVELNGKLVTNMDMSKWTSATTNPDGTKIPKWLSTPFSKLPTKGYIGFQGKHAGAKVYFRNIKIRRI